MVFKRCLVFWILFTSILLAGLREPLLAQIDNRIPFKHRVGNPAPYGNLFHIRGDFALIGNTSLTLVNYDDNLDNSYSNMVYVDVDNDTATVNSSSATLLFSQENGTDPSCTG